MEITKFVLAVMFTLLIFLGLGITEIVIEKIEKKFKRNKRKNKVVETPKEENHFYNFIIE